MRLTVAAKHRTSRRRGSTLRRNLEGTGLPSPSLLFGSLGACHKPPGTARPRLLRIFAFFVFCVSFARSAFQRERECGASIWLRPQCRAGRGLSPLQREKFFEAFVSAALRLDRVAMRDWLRKRLRNRPLAAPVDLTRFAISDVDIASLLRAAGEAAAGPDRDEDDVMHDGLRGPSKDF